MKHRSIRALLAMVTLHNLELKQLGVKTTFLHDELKEKIYMSQLEGFIILGIENHVYLLKKSFYVYKRFDIFMVNNGFIQTSYDSCVYHSKLLMIDLSICYYIWMICLLMLKACHILEL